MNHLHSKIWGSSSQDHDTHADLHYAILWPDLRNLRCPLWECAHLSTLHRVYSSCSFCVFNCVQELACACKMSGVQRFSYWLEALRAVVTLTIHFILCSIHYYSPLLSLSWFPFICSICPWASSEACTADRSSLARSHSMRPVVS